MELLSAAPKPGRNSRDAVEEKSLMVNDTDAPVLGCQAVSQRDSAAISAEEQRLCDKGSPPGRCPGDPKCRSREGMEESYETFEEELGPPRADPPPQKPVRQIRRPEMYTTRKIKEEMTAVPQQQRSEPKILPREPSFPRPTTLHKTLSIQNLTQIETPWENVTLNRCLFVAITILVLTSGFQRLNETLRGHGQVEEEEVGLRVRRSDGLRHRGQPPQPETSLWEVMFWWLPDLNDDDDDEEEDDDGEVKRGKSRRGAGASRGLRNRPLPDKKLMKQREGKAKIRGAKNVMAEETKDKKHREKPKKSEPPVDEDDEENEENEEATPKKIKKVEKMEKKKTQKG